MVADRNKRRSLSDMQLAALVAGATLVGGVVSSIADALWIDAGKQRETDVQLVELAIGILSQPIDNTGAWQASASRDEVMRSWAVDTINSVAEVRFDEAARKLLIEGEVNFFSEKARTIMTVESLNRELAEELGLDLKAPGPTNQGEVE